MDDDLDNNISRFVCICRIEIMNPNSPFFLVKDIPLGTR